MWFFSHLIQQKILLSSVLIGIILVTLSRVLLPVMIGIIIDNAFTLQNFDLVLLLILMFIIYLVRNVLDYLTMLLAHYYGLNLEQNMRQEFFDILQSKPLRYHDLKRTGDLEALATNDLRIINTMVSHGSFYIYPFIQVIMIVGMLFFTLNQQLALICTPFILLYIIFIIDYGKRIAPFARDRMVKHSNVAVTLQETLSGAAVVKAFAAEKMERDKFSTAVRGYRENRVGEARVQARFYPLLVIYVAIGVTFLVSIILVAQQNMSIGALTASNLLIVTMIEPTGMIFWAVNDALSGFAACSRLFRSMAVNDAAEESSIEQFQEWPAIFSGKIEFQHVTFYYDTNRQQKPILDDISFTIEAHQRVALVGPTGCGKTTLIKLLLRLYEPQKGHILLDGYDIKSYPLDALRQHIGYVEQEIYLFSRSIEKNIAFGRANAHPTEIVTVAKQAQVDEFVQAFPDKYNTIVGERGTRLSGGEKQRVALARALLMDPKIMILDDSVSAVDSATEDKINRAIEQVSSQRTTIIITHRLHTIRQADKIIVLKHGRIVADGTHVDLLQRSNDYRRIFGMHLTLPPLQVEIAQ